MPMKPRALLLLAAGFIFTACAGGSAASPGYSTGSGGSVGNHCTTIACVPSLTGSLSLAMEIDPPNSATTAAITELPSVDLSVEPIPPKLLMAVAGTSVTATFTAPSNAAAPSSANVVLTVPTTIPGRPDLTFQAPTVGGASVSVISGSLTVPLTAIDRPATLALIPAPPADQQSPPFSFPVTVGAMLGEEIPGDGFTISGTLVSAVGTAPAATFVARALQDGVVVSNAPLTQSNGPTDSFRLLLPAAVTANGNPLTIQLMPQGSAPADPWFVSGPIAPQANTTALSIMLPAYSNLNEFKINIKGSDDRAVAGALVHAQTVVGVSTVGSTQFARDGLTDANGTVNLSLLPGTAQTALKYQITVVPPTNSPSGIPCDIPVDVTVGGSTVNVASAPTLMTIMLAARPTLTGVVKDSQGYPLSNVTVTATQETSDNAACTSATPIPTSATSNLNGMFALALDPGTYQIDYDPPTGSAAPRFTEYGYRIDGQALMMTHDVTLPAGAAVAGTVLAPDGRTTLQSATVRLFEVRCMGADCTGPNRTAPMLRAVTVTDGNGSFRVAVAAPAQR
jgi:hypothetical protein